MSWPAPEQDRQYLEEVFQRTREAIHDLRQAKHTIGEIESTGEAADGMIRATADGGGSIRKLKINPRALRLDTVALGREVTRAIQAAQEDSARRAQEILDGVTARVGALPEPLDERLIEHRVEAVARELYSGGL
ncbi:YbaB/EbfC family nucleoid-associated protein [Nonomuraea sp. B12E4]|uniref:YbaB/EbfC family nucleoid-associated protein n=1 Tax=Nonomuraea sp. B12E4 TaxID=3153564 RepID=UPI00325D87BF